MEAVRHLHSLRGSVATGQNISFGSIADQHFYPRMVL
jgi:hypothetical protein